MRYVTLLALSFILFMTLAPGALAQEYPERSKALPEEIEAFYHDFNFVSSFSTFKERLNLLRLVRLLPEAQVQKRLPARLKKVRELSNRLETRRWRVDPGIAAPKARHFPDKRENKLERLRYALEVSVADVHPADLVEIENFRAIKGGIALRVHTCSLNSEANLALISDYEEHPGDERQAPSILERPELAKRCRIEIHPWIQMEGHWMLKEAKIQLLN